jgi:formate dehydrogenase maturation protein FdhE
MKYFEDDGKPVKCHKCGSEKIKLTTKDMIDNMVCEVEYSCGDCGTYLAYWSYGYFETDC